MCIRDRFGAMDTLFSLSTELTVMPIFCGRLKVEKLVGAIRLFGVERSICESVNAGVIANNAIAANIVNKVLFFTFWFLLSIF